MPFLEPPDPPPARASEDDPRIGALLGGQLSHPGEARVVLVGFPCDEGVRRNGGRPGAAGGPEALRRCLYRLTPDPRHFDLFVDLIGHAADLGDLVLDGPMEARQEALGDVLAPHLRRGAVAVVLGGGHETAFGHFLGYVRAGLEVSLLNWDAHPDVRPLEGGRGHSGTPFREALLHASGACRGYTVAGLLPQSVARAHLRFLEEQGGRYLWREECTGAALEALYAGLDGPALVSFDLDAVDQSAAPGVSAPAVGGLSAERWLQAAYEAGRAPGVRSIDVVELNPAFDPDDRTARLGALTIWHFLRGLATRAAGVPIA